LWPSGFPSSTVASTDNHDGGDSDDGGEEKETTTWRGRVAEPASLLPWLPHAGHEAKYSEGTWEWTIGREFVDHFSEHAAYLLEKTLASPTQEDGARRALPAASSPGGSSAPSPLPPKRAHSKRLVRLP